MLNGYCREERENKFKVQKSVDKLMASVLCYSEGTLLVEFRAMCADVKEVIITKSKGSAK